MPEPFPTQSKIAPAEIAAAERHLFLCIGPDCCDPDEGEALWRYLKSAVKKRGIGALRTKAACLRVCAGGPWLVVYPEGTWYGEMTVERLERVLREHVAGGRPIEEWVTARTASATEGQCPAGAEAAPGVCGPAIE